MNKKKLSFIFFIICILTVFVSLSLTKAAAETSATTSNSKTVDTITSLSITNKSGDSLDGDLKQWVTFRLNANYDLIIHFAILYSCHSSFEWMTWHKSTENIWKLFFRDVWFNLNNDDHDDDDDNMASSSMNEWMKSNRPTPQNENHPSSSSSSIIIHTKHGNYVFFFFFFP